MEERKDKPEVDSKEKKKIKKSTKQGELNTKETTMEELEDDPYY